VTGASTANFYYDADGAQVKTIVNGVTTYYVGNHYEVKNSVVTKYYFAGATRLAVRTGGTLSYLLGDHIGSSSVTTDANGVKTASALYKAFGETRFSAGALGTDYKFTGQREEASLGIYYFNARWMDPSLGRFTSPDSIVPTSTQGTQAWDRYAFVNNNPVRYNDPTGHCADLFTFFLCAMAAGAVIGAVGNIVRQVASTGGVQDWSEVGAAAVEGALVGGGIAIALVATAVAATAVAAAGVLALADSEMADATAVEGALPDDALVCRGGACTADRFTNGAGVTSNPDGTLSGVSVNSSSGASAADLSASFPHSQVGVTTAGDVRAAGGTIYPTLLDTNPFHATIDGLTAEELEELFTPTVPNPSQ
jgi:RHS repeat-associated protein